MNELKERASSMVSHLCRTAGGFFLKVRPVTESRLVMPVAKRCRQASQGAAVCRFPLRRSFSRKRDASRLELEQKDWKQKAYICPSSRVEF